MNMKQLVIIAIQIPVALLHFVTGEHYSGPFPDFVNGYLIDILLPFAAYFLMSNTEKEILKRWYIKFIIVFSIGFSVETAQYFGAPILGRTFDPLDYLMYALGASLAVIADLFIFSRIFNFWTQKTGEST